MICMKEDNYMTLLLIKVIGIIFLFIICAGGVLMYYMLGAFPTESSRTIDPDPALKDTNKHPLHGIV